MKLKFFGMYIIIFFLRYYSVLSPNEWVLFPIFHCKAITRYSEPIRVNSKLANRDFLRRVFPRRFVSMHAGLYLRFDWLISWSVTSDCLKRNFIMGKNILISSSVWLTADSKWITIEDKGYNPFKACQKKLVPRRWGGGTLKFDVKQVDKGQSSTVKRFIRATSLGRRADARNVSFASSWRWKRKAQRLV